MMENLPAIFSKEIEKFIKSIEDIKEDMNGLNQKLISLVEKLENSIQQYELVFHESEKCRETLSQLIPTITDKILIEIFKIKNPNETLYELMKVFFKLLTENKQNTQTSQMSFSWMFLQSNIKKTNIQRDLNDLLINKEISKELIDQCMPFNLNYTEIKQSLVKINKHLLIILDFIKSAVDFNIKKNIVKNLFQSNLNRNAKLNSLKEQIEIKGNLIKESSEYKSVMQSELTNLLTKRNSKQLYKYIVTKYDYLKKYKIFYDTQEESHIDYSNSESNSNNSISIRENNNHNMTQNASIIQFYNSKSNVVIKLKSKFRTKDDFVKSILTAKEKNEKNPITQSTQLINMNMNSNNQMFVQSQSSPIKERISLTSNMIENFHFNNEKREVAGGLVLSPSDSQELNNISAVPKLKIPKTTASILENTTTRSRNIQNNPYVCNIQNLGYTIDSKYSNGKPFTPGNQSNIHPPSNKYTERLKETERERITQRENYYSYAQKDSTSQKHKSLGSTIYRDIETLENIIREDKNCDVVPINFAVKPQPKKIVSNSQIEQSNTDKQEHITSFPSLGKNNLIDMLSIELDYKSKDIERNQVQRSKNLYNTNLEVNRREYHGQGDEKITPQVTPNGNQVKIDRRCSYSFYCCK